MLRAGIVGLPNVGKSTLFNALTRSRNANAENYPFCTIEPNVGVVQVPDERLQPLAKIGKSKLIIPAAFEFVDIAGLVAGASEGEGLGNRFLSHIREVDAIIQVVRCFQDKDVVHLMGTVDPVRDIEIITAELILADLQSIENQLKKNTKKARGGDKEAAENIRLLERLMPHLNEMNPASTLPLSDDEQPVLKRTCLLSAKPNLFACNISEIDLANPYGNPFVAEVEKYVKNRHDAGTCVICGKLEEDLADLSKEEAAEYLAVLGTHGSGVDGLIKTAFGLLGLATFLTVGEEEARAWTFQAGMKAPQCAGLIHTDFEKGFIKAEVVSYEDLIKAGSIAEARQVGKYRLEGKDYAFIDGDVVLFRFNV